MSQHDPQTTVWQRVPRTLTPRMREAFWCNMTRDIEDGKPAAADECWAAILKAATEEGCI